MKVFDILFVSTSSQASPTGGGRTRIVAEARQAKQRNHVVIILCLVPFEQVLTFKLSLLEGRKRLARESGCRVFYVPSLPLRRIPIVNSLNSWYAGLIIFLFCWKYKIEIVHCHATSASFFASLAKRINRALNLVVDIHGASVEQYLYAKNLTQKDETAETIEIQEEHSINEADWIIFVSHAMSEHYERKYGQLCNYSIIPCATEETTFQIDFQRRKTLRTKYGIDENLVLCYVGSAVKYQLPDVMCALFRKVLDQFQNTFFLIFSGHRDAFLEHLEAAGVGDKHYKIVSVEHERIFDLLQMGDIGFLLREDSIVNRVASPTKFAEYCLSGLPVITTDYVGDVSDMVRRYGLGWIVDPEEITLDSGLNTFINEVTANRLAYAVQCSDFARRHFTWEHYGDELSDIYVRLSENKT